MQKLIKNSSKLSRAQLKRVASSRKAYAELARDVGKCAIRVDKALDDATEIMRETRKFIDGQGATAKALHDHHTWLIQSLTAVEWLNGQLEPRGIDVVGASRTYVLAEAVADKAEAIVGAAQALVQKERTKKPTA